MQYGLMYDSAKRRTPDKGFNKVFMRNKNGEIVIVDSNSPSAAYVELYCFWEENCLSSHVRDLEGNRDIGRTNPEGIPVVPVELVDLTELNQLKLIKLGKSN